MNFKDILASALLLTALVGPVRADASKTEKFRGVLMPRNKYAKRKAKMRMQKKSRRINYA